MYKGIPTLSISVTKFIIGDIKMWLENINELKKRANMSQIAMTSMITSLIPLWVAKLLTLTP